MDVSFVTGGASFSCRTPVPFEAVRAVIAFSPPSWVQLMLVGPNLSLLSHFTALYNHCPPHSFRVLAADAKTTALKSPLNWLRQLHETKSIPSQIVSLIPTYTLTSDWSLTAEFGTGCGVVPGNGILKPNSFNWFWAFWNWLSVLIKDINDSISSIHRNTDSWWHAPAKQVTQIIICRYV